MLAGYFLSPRPLKNIILLIASVLFYGAGEGYSTFIVLFSIAFNYFSGRYIERKRISQRGSYALVAAVVVNLGILATFKYAAFLVDNLNALLWAVDVQ